MNTTAEASITERTKTAAKRFLEHRGYEVRSTWESKDQYGFIAKGEDAVAFIRLVSNGIDKPGFPEEPTMSRDEFEQVACNILAADENGDMTDMPVRFDVLALKVLCADRAFIRHHINVLGMDEDLQPISRKPSAACNAA